MLMWMEIGVNDNISLFLDENCFVPDCIVKNIENYLHFLEEDLNTHILTVQFYSDTSMYPVLQRYFTDQFLLYQ